MYSGGNVLPGFVQHSPDGGSGFGQPVVCLLDDVTIRFLGFHDEQHHVHEPGQT